jgi:beta-galactosidase/beta-glucuronidase
MYLDGSEWTASTQQPSGFGQEQQLPKINITVVATVPGDLLTDLQRAKVISDPWLDTTWIQKSSIWTDHAWTYTTKFTVSDAVMASHSTLLLTFDGVKMGATVRVNGQTVGVLRDQFLRYSFTLDVTKMGLLAGAGANRLDVTFGVDDVAEDGRFMACTGGKR